MRPLAVALVVSTGAALAGAGVAGCLKRPAFQCAVTEECGPGGACESDGFCSFADNSCPNGRRYGDHSGPNAGDCVGEIGPNPDGPLPDTESDGPPPDARQCFGAGAYEVCLLMAPTGAVTLAGALDTVTDGRCLAAQPGMWMTNGQPNACFIVGETITVNGALTVTGTRPLVLVGPDITVMALLDVAGHGATVGAAGNATACAAFAGAPGDAASGVAGGGAGGSFMFKGGNGGRADMTGPIGGIAAAADGAAPTVLRGGCSGQAGGNAGGISPGAPGAGGGVVFIAATTLTISGSGILNASGGGAGGGGVGAGGSGAGAGGMIVLHADVFAVTGGRLLANGGGGASGSDNNSTGNSGNDPLTNNVTVGGSGGNNPGGNGGDGFATGNNPADPGANGNNGDAGGGGGGGGGYIQSNKALTGALVSPAPTIVP